MSGCVIQRGKKGQWYAVINVVEGGKRKRLWHKLENCSGKREAQIKLAELIAARNRPRRRGRDDATSRYQPSSSRCYEITASSS
jgi:hypothetical protein